MRVPDRQRRCIGYRLNIIGVRVWADHCQLVAKDRAGRWEPFGPVRPLPVFVPQDPRRAESDPLLLTAWQYVMERPGSDLMAVLAKQKPFDEALHDDGETCMSGGTAA